LIRARLPWRAFPFGTESIWPKHRCQSAGLRGLSSSRSSCISTTGGFRQP
jgi:hypothetical protein